MFKHDRRAVGAIRRPARLILAALLAASAVTFAPAAPAAHADAAGQGGDYVPLSGVAKVLDTRDGTGGVTGERGAGSTTAFPVLGAGGVPTTGVSSVMVRIAALAPTAPTFLILWPDGRTKPGTTTLSVGTGEDLSTMAVVDVGDNGKLAVFNNAGKTGIVVEVQGYFKSSLGSTGGGFVPVPHARLVDTRSGTGTSAGALAAGASRTITLTGGVIPAGAAVAAVNVAVPSATTAGWLAVAPAGGSARPLMNYESGSTHTFAPLKLSADGKVTVTNKGSAAVDVLMHVEGYWSASSTQGAGYRHVGKRLLNTRTAGAGLPLAAGATIDVQVGGTNGLPTRGVAGAQLGVTVTPEAAGYLKAWPVGQTEASLTLMDFKAGAWRSQGMIVKPGTDGKVRFRNGSGSTIHFIVDLQGWYADPIPQVPIAKSTRVSVMQMAPVDGARAGVIKYAYVDDGGRVVTGHQPYPENFGYVEWTVISGNEAFTGQPALAETSDGRVQVTAQNTDSDIWSATQTAAGSATWNAWSNAGGSMAAPPTAIRLGSGVLTQFAVDADGKLWSYEQDGTPAWRNLGDQNLTGQVTAVKVRDGARVFGVDTDGSVRSVELYDDGSVSSWTSLGGSGLSQPAVVVRPGYVLQAFARAADNTIVTKIQQSGGAWPAEWTSIGSFGTAEAPATFTATGAPAAVIDPELGRVSVVVRGADNKHIYQLWESSVGSNTWGAWHESIPSAGEVAATDPTVMAYSLGTTQGFAIVFRNGNGSVKVYDRSLDQV
ncbi:hypothetical protein Ade02nite_00840 [Paractinoplanes deccanensis]|uniref:PLL-like beta propeller domain-containing protein n=1 Tax=Paractinoplanes deccanensis TaxID=113561 RepID=A0ABQ3XUM7_9ACTN|nr:hypothetical protein [Actinoplanes deccanensis]GID71443.1 hypothetical protein Ade02nite_00840 [Actinoplanes deccanensis]